MMQEMMPSYLDAFPELKGVLDRMKDVKTVKEHIDKRGY